jgi:hypothetical protein
MSEILLVDPANAGWQPDSLIGADKKFRLIGENIFYTYESALLSLHAWKAVLAKFNYEVGVTAKLFCVAHLHDKMFDVDTYVTDLAGIISMRLSDDWKSLKMHVGEIQERK